MLPLVPLLVFVALAGCGEDGPVEVTEPQEIAFTASLPHQSLELAASPAPDSPVRNVILMVADGLGFAQVTAARTALAGVDSPLLFERFPFTGWQTTHALAGSLTDSAASATAMATGHKTWSGSLAVDGEGRALRTLVEAAREVGLATGLATSSYLLDATPAAFVAHVESRRMGSEIAAQMASSGVDLLIGERGKDLKAAHGVEPATVLGFEREGYRLITSWEEVASAAAGPLLVLLPNKSIADPGQGPSLAEVASLAISRLQAGERGFFLLLEDEEPDSGGHRNDWPRIEASLRAVEEAAQVAAEFASRRGDTLVLLTSDHETGGLVLERAGRERPPSPRFTGDRHTGVPVPIYAFGAGADRFTGVLDNTEIAWRIAGLLDLELDAEAAVE